MAAKVLAHFSWRHVAACCGGSHGGEDIHTALCFHAKAAMHASCQLEMSGRGLAASEGCFCCMSEMMLEDAEDGQCPPSPAGVAHLALQCAAGAAMKCQ